MRTYRAAEEEEEKWDTGRRRGDRVGLQAALFGNLNQTVIARWRDFWWTCFVRVCVCMCVSVTPLRIRGEEKALNR